MQMDEATRRAAVAKPYIFGSGLTLLLQVNAAP